MREWFAYHIQNRKDELPTFLYLKRLIQQFCLWIRNVIPNAEDIERIISVEISDKNFKHELYDIVKETMIH